MSATPKAGHNLPPFDPANIVDLAILGDQVRDAYKFKFDRRDELLAGLNTFMADAANGITDDEHQAAATDVVAQIMAEIDAIDGPKNSIRETSKAPFLKGGRIVDGILKGELADQMRTAIEPLKYIMAKYAVDKHNAAMAAARQAEKEAAEEAVRQQAALRPSSSEADHQAALDAEQAALDAAAAANVKVSDNTRTYGELGTSSGLRGTWKARVIDVEKLPRAYMMPDMAMIEAKMTSSRGPKKGPPTAQIPGVEFYQDFSLAVRK